MTRILPRRGRNAVRFAVASAIACLSVSRASAAVNATWGTGSASTSGNWSTSGTSAGWAGGIPDAVGDSGTYNITGSQSSVTTTQDATGTRTVGALTVTGTVDRSWSIALASGKNLTLNQDGAGSGFATISNTINSTGTSATGAALIFSGTAGVITLADDLLISNTSTSVRTSGAIQFESQIQGAGNIRFYNVSNDPAVAAIALHRGSTSASSNFIGNSTIAKGAVTFNRGDRFSPNPGNVITIGEAGSGSATLVYAASALGNMENNFVAAAGSGGTLVFGTTAAATGNVNIKTSNTDAASFQLNGDLSFISGGTGTLIIGDRINGVGKLTKIGAGPMRVSHTNSYAGGTQVDAGILIVGNAPFVDNGFGQYAPTFGTLGSGSVTVNTTATRLELEAGVTNVIADLATLSLAGGGTVGAADLGYILLGAGVNETVGGLVLGGVAQTLAGTYGSTSSGATFQSDEFFSGTGFITLVPVPEPGSLALVGMAGLGLIRRRRQ